MRPGDMMVVLGDSLMLLLNFAVIIAAIASAIIYLVRVKHQLRIGIAAAMAVAAVASYLLSLYQAYLGMGAISGAVLSASVAVLFAIAASAYFEKRQALYYALGVAALMMITSTLMGAPIVMFMQSFSMGTIAGIFVSMRHNGNRNHNSRAHNKKETEINRDIFQICSGIVLLLMLLISFRVGEYLLMALVLLGYAAVFYLPKGAKATNPLSKILLGLERPETTFGFGALYLAAGALLVIALVPDFRLMMFGLVALFISDSLATICGLRIRSPRLPYNKGKSVAGSVVYFAVLAIAGILFIGYYSIAIAVVLAFIEGISSRIDDNVSVASALVLISAALML